MPTFGHIATIAGAWFAATVGALGQTALPPAYGPLPVAPYAPPPTPYVASPGQLSDACYTTRGTCYLQHAQPVGGRCRCFIPGFGQRKGFVQP